jgi:hypothetical protein
MHSKLSRLILILAVALALAYVAMMIAFQSPLPSDIYYLVTSSGWRIDSAFVLRRVVHLRDAQDRAAFETTADSVWDFSVRLYGRNLARRSVTIDSISVHNLQNDITYRVPFWEHLNVESGKTNHSGLIVGRQSFEIGDYVRDREWFIPEHAGAFQRQFDAAFQAHALQIFVRSSRGNLKIIPSHYVTTGSHLEWTEVVRVSQH